MALQAEHALTPELRAALERETLDPARYEGNVTCGSVQWSNENTYSYSDGLSRGVAELPQPCVDDGGDHLFAEDRNGDICCSCRLRNRPPETEPASGDLVAVDYCDRVLINPIESPDIPPILASLQETLARIEREMAEAMFLPSIYFGGPLVVARPEPRPALDIAAITRDIARST